jgi:hypothetical protein
MVTDRRGLEDYSCDCYGLLRELSDRTLGNDGRIASHR